MTVELTGLPGPNGIEFQMLDYGITLRPNTGAEVLRINRKGSRFRAVVSHPPMEPEVARKMINRLLRAKRQGLRIDVPLLGINQGVPGSPVVNATAPSGYSLPVRGLNVGYQLKEGFWLSIVDATGRHFLHMVTADVTVPTGGIVSIPIEPAIRHPFANGAVVHLAAPKMQGFVDGDSWGWTVPLDRLVAISYPLEESA